MKSVYNMTLQCVTLTCDRSVAFVFASSFNVVACVTRLNVRCGPKPAAPVRYSFVRSISLHLFHTMLARLQCLICDFVMVPFFLSIFHRFPPPPYIRTFRKIVLARSPLDHCAFCACISPSNRTDRQQNNKKKHTHTTKSVRTKHTLTMVGD